MDRPLITIKQKFNLDSIVEKASGIYEYKFNLCYYSEKLSSELENSGLIKSTHKNDLIPGEEYNFSFNFYGEPLKNEYAPNIELENQNHSCRSLSMTFEERFAKFREHFMANIESPWDVYSFHFNLPKNLFFSLHKNFPKIEGFDFSLTSSSGKEYSSKDIGVVEEDI